MKFNFRDKYESATEWAAEEINRVIDSGISISFKMYDFSKNMGSKGGRKKNWEDIKKKSADLARVVMKEAKEIWKDVADNWEAAIILTFASIGLTNIIGGLPSFIKLPGFFESPMVVPVIAVIIITILVMLIERKMKGATDENVGERAG